jgi:hypothetical protein
MKTLDKKDSNQTGLDIFLSKLKEQSFVIILMLGGLYYQNKIFEDQLERMRIREAYLVEQRDKYVEDIINKK